MAYALDGAGAVGQTAGMDPMVTVEISCPYCGETLELLIDRTAGPQAYVEDCQVCCRPMDIRVTFDRSGLPVVDSRREDD